MNTRSAAAVALLAAASLALTACGGGSEGTPAESSTPTPSTSQVEGQGEGEGPSEGAPQGGGQGAPGVDYPVEAGGVYTYPDGLEVQVGNWRVDEKATSGEPARSAYLDVTATNPTGEPITTTQVWVSVRAGETGEELQGWAGEESVYLDAILQPGASATGTYILTAPETPGRVVATVLWHESDDPVMRYETTFTVED